MERKKIQQPANFLPKVNKLIAEIDLDHSDYDVILRVYHKKNDSCNLLRTQEIYNLCQSLSCSSEKNSFWNGEDQRLLKQLKTFVNTPAQLKSNLQVVKIPRRKFPFLLNRWQKSPRRFIERKTKQPYSTVILKPSIHFELSCQGKNSRLSAVVNGIGRKAQFYYQLCNETFLQEGEYLIQGKRYQVHFPIDKATMDLVFGTSNPEFPTHKVVEHLPALLQNRLDLLQGPSVTKKRQTVKGRIECKPDGADILIAFFLNTFSANLAQKGPVSSAQLVRKGNHFEIQYFSCPHIEEIMRLLRALPFSGEKKSHWRLPGLPENIERLHTLYRTLEHKTSFVIHRDLQTLFDQRNHLKATLIIREGQGWLDVNIVCQKGDTIFDNITLQQAIKNNNQCIRTRNGQWLWIGIEELKKLHEVTQKMGITLGRQQVLNVQSQKIIQGLQEENNICIHPSSTEIVDRLQKQWSNPLPPPQYSPQLKSCLRAYQKEGANFLYHLTNFEIGCILGDDMGLGKTIQTLSFLVALKKQQKKPLCTLVVCPASVSSVWINEAKIFAPELRVCSLQGIPDKRKEIIKSSEDWDILVTTYTIVRNDVFYLQSHIFQAIILDEAQYIKNPDAETTKAIKSLRCMRRIALTGTPLENHLTDLWSIMDFLNPNYLGSQATFQNNYVLDPNGRVKLSNKLSPLIRRRLKEKVATELPSRTEEVLAFPLAEQQQKLYDQEWEKSKTIDSQKGAMEVLAALMRLRRICCHPSLLNKRENKDNFAECSSAKLDFLLERIQELQDQGHSCLIFSQFTDMLDIIEKTLSPYSQFIYKITGKTPVKKRPKIVDDFQNSSDPSIFLLSLKAAGTGLTLTKADYVFIYDPWWNPAAERQAIDRTHRIGQDKPVIAYKLIASNTIEEKVLALQDKKRELFSQVIEGASLQSSSLEMKQLMALLTN